MTGILRPGTRAISKHLRRVRCRVHELPGNPPNIGFMPPSNQWFEVVRLDKDMALIRHEIKHQGEALQRLRPEIGRARAETKQEVREMAVYSTRAIYGFFTGLGGLYLKIGYDAYQNLQAKMN